MILKNIALSFCLSCLAWACSGNGNESAIDDLREAEAAVAVGDMEVAKNVASKVIGKSSLSSLPASQLARLSLVYMQIADSTERESSIAQATDLYRRAYQANPDSAAAFYSEVNPEQYTYVAMLRTLVGHLDNPYNPEADSLEEYHDTFPDFPTDSLK